MPPKAAAARGHRHLLAAGRLLVKILVKRKNKREKVWIQKKKRIRKRKLWNKRKVRNGARTGLKKWQSMLEGKDRQNSNWPSNEVRDLEDKDKLKSNISLNERSERVCWRAETDKTVNDLCMERPGRQIQTKHKTKKQTKTNKKTDKTENKKTWRTNTD